MPLVYLGPLIVSAAPGPAWSVGALEDTLPISSLSPLFVDIVWNNILRAVQVSGCCRSYTGLWYWKSRVLWIVGMLI